MLYHGPGYDLRYTAIVSTYQLQIRRALRFAATITPFSLSGHPLSHRATWSNGHIS